MEEDIDLRLLRELIMYEDSFTFIKVADEDTDEPFSFYFRHISIANAIYESLSYLKKNLWHTAVGKILENRMNESNRAALLPVVHHHYSLTSSTEKRLAFTEELGMDYNNRGYKREATTVMKSLIDFADSEDIPTSLISNERKAVWHATLASAASAHYVRDIVISSATKALRLIGIEFPVPDEMTTHILLKSIYKQFKLFRRTKGGRISLFGASHSNINITRHLCADQALQALLWVAIPSSTMSDSYKGLILLELLNQSIVIGTTVPALWAMRAIVASYLLILKIPWLSEVYFQAAKEAWNKSDAEDVSQAFNFYWTLLLSTHFNFEELDHLLIINEKYYQYAK
ncbi:hypothetical protein HDU67_006682 [Dinochytrium kinnereticum]|nr:hypothetical protein HDU67_006682 [Dinochytrium kinnereticum]